MMHMTFYWGKSVTLLFDAWSVHTWMGYMLTLLVCFLFSILHEWLATQRSIFVKPPTKLSPDLRSDSSQSKSDSSRAPLLREIRGPNRAGRKALEALLFAVKVGLGYFLMLAAMSFNGGVFLVIVVGLAVGYFMFRSGNDAPLSMILAARTKWRRLHITCGTGFKGSGLEVWR